MLSAIDTGQQAKMSFHQWILTVYINQTAGQNLFPEVGDQHKVDSVAFL